MIFTHGTKVSTAPDTEPFEVSEAKEWLKVDFTADDTLIGLLINAARQAVENATGLALYTQTVVDKLDHWPRYENVTNPHQAFHLLRYPVQSVSSITYYDSDGVQQTWDSSNYILDNTGTYGRVAAGASVTLPSLQDRINAVEITYTAGYSTVGNIPEDIISAMKLMIAHWYHTRQDSVRRMPTQAEHLLSKHYVHI